jgi:hypothetical protein
VQQLSSSDFGCDVYDIGLRDAGFQNANREFEKIQAKRVDDRAFSVGTR